MQIKEGRQMFCCPSFLTSNRELDGWTRGRAGCRRRGQDAGAWDQQHLDWPVEGKGPDSRPVTHLPVQRSARWGPAPYSPRHPPLQTITGGLRTPRMWHTSIYWVVWWHRDYRDRLSKSTRGRAGAASDAGQLLWDYRASSLHPAAEQADPSHL